MRALNAALPAPTAAHGVPVYVVSMSTCSALDIAFDTVRHLTLVTCSQMTGRDTSDRSRYLEVASMMTRAGFIERVLEYDRRVRAVVASVEAVMWIDHAGTGDQGKCDRRTDL